VLNFLASIGKCAGMLGTPSFFTGRKDGIPAPALDLCMSRYWNMLIMNMPSKILDNIYLFMNMPAWTNEKSF
jgi:hypothetical protein